MARLSWHWSIERKVPLFVSAVLVAVGIVLSGAAYEEARRAARLIASARLERATAELADLFQRSTTQRRTETATLAADPAVRALVASGGRRGQAPALQALRRVAAENAPTAAVEVWDASGHRLLRSGDSALTAAAAPPPGSDSAQVGPLRLARDTVLHYEVRARVVDHGQALGQVVQLRRIAMSPQARQTISGLIGGDITLLLGNAGGDPWTDLGIVLPAPPPEVRAARGTTEYRRGEPKLGAATPVRGTPWMLVVEFSRDQVFSPAEAFLERMALIASAVVLLGALAAWSVSRRITTPLRQLSVAAEAIAGGDLTQRVEAPTRDELGRLAHSFNAMAEQVGRAHHDLEAQVAERTRELESATRQLEQTSEERYRTLFEQNPLPMWLYDPATLAFLDVNEAAVRHYGYSRGEFLGMTLKDIRPPDDVPRFLASLGTAPSGLYEAGVWTHQKKDGTIIQAEVTRHSLRIQGRAVSLALAQDVTARLAAEAALQRMNAELEARVQERTHALASSEERFRALSETANDAIFSADHRGVIVYANQAAERIFGYPATMMVGQPLTLIMPARLRDAHRAGLARYLSTGEARVVGRTVELVGQRRDGSEFPVELSLASRTTPAGPLFIGIIRDITERKRIEQALRETNAELESFSYSVSHDLRAPLRAIHGFARILVEDHGGGLDPEARRVLGVIDDNTKRMGQLIDDLLAFSRLGRQELDTARVDMTELVRSVADGVRRGEGDRTLDIVVDPLPPARGDRGLLRQALTNLLQNAAKFTRRRAAAHVAVGARADGTETVYYVKDNGAGFDPRYADKLFGVFQRLHRLDEFEGTGVGLAIVQRIIHRHGGRVWAEGKLGGGATFFFTLPGATRA
ncbi:MAG TPA: PAS domain S-box protein [Gemmatimonadales bacterium]|jgi:PAS domain S-box-containing protein|nr:PAS domain S-box protein [Gemmatimonadales bacterium]